MKGIACVVASLGCASAFVPVALPVVPKSTSRMSMVGDKSIALPFDKRPAALDGTLVGDVGFDPAGFTNNPPRAGLFGGSGGSTLKWYREAEITHGRVAQLAALGWIFPEIYHLPGNAEVGIDAFAKTNPWEAFYAAPDAGLWQIFFAAGYIEYNRISRTIKGDAEPGDLGLGQGEGRWNPFGFNYSPEEYRAKQLQEIKHGRLAMVAIIGMMLQSNNTGTGILQQLSGSFNFPEAVGKAGYYFPDGL